MPASEAAARRDALAAIAREAGEIALVASKKPLKHWTKVGSSPVSEADLAVNDFLLKRLPPLVPGAGWLSEETEDDLARTAAAEVWVVDPIDGTRAYIDGRADWSVSIALVRDGRPVTAVVYAPVTDELFFAALGEGATVNGTRMRVSGGDELAGARVAGPQSFLKRIGEINPRTLPQPKVHSLALRLSRVADGGFDAAFAAKNAHDWDLAAADLLIYEAGGALTDLAGTMPVYNRENTVHNALVAAGRERHDALIALLRDRRADFA